MEKDSKDEVLYATYQGDAGNLYPASQSGPNLSAQDRKSLMNMINGRQQLRSASELSNDLFDSMSKSMSGQIEAVVRNLIK
jgi:hypothetical protein